MPDQVGHDVGVREGVSNVLNHRNLRFVWFLCQKYKYFPDSDILLTFSCTLLLPRSGRRWIYKILIIFASTDLKRP